MSDVHLRGGEYEIAIYVGAAVRLIDRMLCGLSPDRGDHLRGVTPRRLARFTPRGGVRGTYVPAACAANLRDLFW